MPFLLLSAGAGLLSSVIGAGSAKSAGDAQAAAAMHAADLQNAQFQQTEKNEAPYLSAGGNALQAMLKGLGLAPGNSAGVPNGSLIAPFDPRNLSKTPGYQFEMQQGLGALLDSKTATGGVGGGNTLKAITQYGQDLASTTYQQQFDDYMASQSQRFGELQTVAGSGQNAAANLGALGAQTAASVGQDIIGAGNAKAAGTVGAANAFSSGIGGISQNYLLAQLLGQGRGGGGLNLDAASGFGTSAYTGLPDPYTMGTGL